MTTNYGKRGNYTTTHTKHSYLVYAQQMWGQRVDVSENTTWVCVEQCKKICKTKTMIQSALVVKVTLCGLLELAQINSRHPHDSVSPQPTLCSNVQIHWKRNQRRTFQTHTHKHLTRSLHFRTYLLRQARATGCSSQNGPQWFTMKQN